MTDLRDIWRTAVTGELCWVGSAETPRALPVVPLVFDEVLCVALPYSFLDEVAELRSAREAGFTVTDSRSLRTGEAGHAAVGAVSVVDDVDGALFTEHLLRQELLKFPPSRALADSPLLRRENWWWLPRLVVRLERLDRGFPLPARADPAAEALLVRDGTGLRIDVVRAADWDAERITLRTHDGIALYGDGAPALVLGHDYTVPDLERWEPWTRRGTLYGNELSVTQRSGTPAGPLEPLGIWERLRRHRALHRTCRDGVARAERTARHPG